MSLWRQITHRLCTSSLFSVLIRLPLCFRRMKVQCHCFNQQTYL